MTFDWHTWLDVQRQQAEKRQRAEVRPAASLPGLLEQDPEYARALGIADRASRARRELEDAEREARGMSPGRGRS